MRASVRAPTRALVRAPTSEREAFTSALVAWAMRSPDRNRWEPQGGRMPEAPLQRAALQRWVRNHKLEPSLASSALRLAPWLSRSADRNAATNPELRIGACIEGQLPARCSKI